MDCIHAPCKLESFIIVVEIVLEFSGQQDCSQQHLVAIEFVESEVLLEHVVAVDVDNGDDEALRGELGVFLETL